MSRQRQRLINTSETRVTRITNGDSDSASRLPERRGLENGMGGAERGLNGRCRLQGGVESGNETENENEDNENNENDGEGEEEEEGEEDGGPLVPFKIPGNTLRVLTRMPLKNTVRSLWRPDSNIPLLFSLSIFRPFFSDFLTLSSVTVPLSLSFSLSPSLSPSFPLFLFLSLFLSLSLSLSLW